MKKRVMIVRNGPYPVDINAYNDQFIGLARGLAKYGFDSDIFFYSNNGDSIIDIIDENGKIKIHNIKGIKILRTGIYPQLLRKSIQEKYDLIITTEYSQIMSLFFAFSKIPTILYSGPYYNLFKIPFFSPIYDFIFTKTINKKIDKIFTKSELATKYLNEKGYQGVTTVGVGQDVARFSENINISEKSQKVISYMSENKCLLTVGSIDDRKNFSFTLDVLEKLIEKDVSYKLVCIGGGDEKFIEKELAKHSENLRSKIFFVGKIDNRELKHIYNKASFFIHPAKLEIFGMVLLEAMYFETVVISSFNGGSSTLINNGSNGFILDIDKVDTWVKTIIELDQNILLKDKIKYNARRTIENNFTWDVIARNFVNFAEEKLEPKKS